MRGQLRRLSGTFLLAFLLLQGCGGGGGGNDPGPSGENPPPGTYTVSANATGVDGHLGPAEYAFFTLHYTDQSGAEQLEVMGTNTDGPFTFGLAYLPSGSAYRVEFRNADRFAVRCTVENGTGTIAASNVTDVEIACVPAHTVGGFIRGLAPQPSNGFVIQTLHNGELAPEWTLVTESSTTITYPFYAGGNQGFLPGDTYNISIGTQPSLTGVECVVRNGAGVVPEGDVDDVEVLCDVIDVSYQVTGLSGSGLSLRLRGESPEDANSMEVLAEAAIESDGRYSFRRVLYPGQSYRLEIHQQPSDPDQICVVENGEGVAPDGPYVTGIMVVCPNPYRSYRFDNQLTQGTDTPLDSGEQRRGVLYRTYAFGDGPAVPLGSTAGFDTTELFQLHIDNPGAEGVVYSNSSGKTFWAAAESPAGVRQPQLDTSHHNLTDLTTWWRFRKDRESANLQLEVSEVYLLGFDDTHSGNALGRLYAEAQLWVKVFGRSDEGEFTDEVFSSHGGVALQGKLLAPDTPIDWSLFTVVEPSATHGLWKVDNFLFDLIGDEIGRDPERVALAFLTDSIPIPIDISAVPIGAEFYVNARTLVLARNSFSPEGGTVVFLRDPATFEAGDPASPETFEDSGGMRIASAEGLTLLALDTAPQPASDSGGMSPPSCESDERSVLELSETAYRVTEGVENSTLISVIRTGALAGLVGARLRIDSGTALENEDYEPREINILFGDGDDHPRTIELPIVDDDAMEPEENLTVTLIDAQGCADIGAQASAEVTIVDDDNRPGAISFASDGFQVDEGAGVATIDIVRTGGQAGALDATLETSDGTALTGEGDYTRVLTTITFADGETGPLAIQVPIGDDALSEADETFEVTLSSLTSQVNAPASATVTIVDNDQNQANTVQFAAASFEAVEAYGHATIRITRSGETSAPASVTLTTSDGTASEGVDYEPLSTVVEFDVGEAAREIEVAIVSDAVSEGEETLNLTLSAPVGVALGVPQAAELTITEDDPTAWGSWQPDVEIDASSGVANDAQIAFDANGNAIAVWVQESGSRTDIWSNYYEPGAGWQSAILVEANDADRYAGSPRVAFDGDGNAIAVWVQTDAITGNESAWANRFTPGTGWGAPELLEAGSDVVSGGVELAMSSSGDAIAVWTQFAGTQAHIYANRYANGSGWTGAEVLDEQNEIVRNAHVAMDEDGDMLVVWQQSATGVNWNIRARRYTQRDDWASSEVVSTTNIGSATDPHVAFDSEGNAIAVWLQNPGFDRAVYASRYTDADEWATPELIGEGDGADHPRVAFAADGTATAIWQRPVNVNGVVVITAFANRFTPDGEWEGAEAISTGHVFYPKVAMNSDGNALAAWFELIGTGYSVWSNRYTQNLGWRFPEQIGSSGGLIGTAMPNLAFGPQGEAFAIWTRGGEVRVNNFRLTVLDAQ